MKAGKKHLLSRYSQRGYLQFNIYQG
ncbi:hypothetical protein [Spirosoma panaciterrae]